MKIQMGSVAVLAGGFICSFAPTINSRLNSNTIINSVSRLPAAEVSTTVTLSDLFAIRQRVLEDGKITTLKKATLVVEGGGDLSQQVKTPIDLGAIEAVEKKVRTFQILQYFEQDTTAVHDLVPQVFGEEPISLDAIVYGVVDPVYQSGSGSQSSNYYPTEGSGKPAFYYRTVSFETGLPVYYELLKNDFSAHLGYGHIDSMYQKVVTNGTPSGTAPMTITHDGAILKFGNITYRRVDSLSVRPEAPITKLKDWRPDQIGTFTDAIVFGKESLRELSGIKKNMADSYAYSFYKNKSGQEDHVIYITATPRFVKDYSKPMIFMRFDKKDGSIQQFDISYDKSNQLHRMLFASLQGVETTSQGIQPLINPETGETLGGIITQPREIQVSQTAENDAVRVSSDSVFANIGTLVGLAGDELLEARSVADLILKPLAPRIVETMDPMVFWKRVLTETGFAKFGVMDVQLGAVAVRAVEAEEGDLVTKRPHFQNALMDQCRETLNIKKIR
jgi:hypothetical protein